MKKSHPFNELSKVICENKKCNRRLKRRLVETRKPAATLCYKCYKRVAKSN